MGFWEDEAFILASKRHSPRKPELSKKLLFPRWPQDGSRWPRRAQDGSKIGPRWPKIVLRWPKMVPRCAKIGLGWPKMDFLGPQKLSWKDLVSQKPETKNGLAFALPLICFRRKHVLPTHDEQSVFGDPVPRSWCEHIVLGLRGLRKSNRQA